MGIFDRIKEKFSTDDAQRIMDESERDDGYVELEGSSSAKCSQKIIVRPFVIQDFEHIKPILDCLRDGQTICLINIKPLKDKDLVELKRAINKLKKTCDAIEGDIAGFGDDWIAAVPNFAKIYRHREEVEKKEDVADVTEYG